MGERERERGRSQAQIIHVTRRSRKHYN